MIHGLPHVVSLGVRLGARLYWDSLSPEKKERYKQRVQQTRVYRAIGPERGLSGNQQHRA
jgi:hypothetical protein